MHGPLRVMVGICSILAFSAGFPSRRPQSKSELGRIVVLTAAAVAVALVSVVAKSPIGFGLGTLFLFVLLLATLDWEDSPDR